MALNHRRLIRPGKKFRRNFFAMKWVKVWYFTVKTRAMKITLNLCLMGIDQLKSGVLAEVLKERL